MSGTKALAWGDMAYDGKSPRQVVDDYVLIRGDLVDEYAREQLADWIDRYADARVAEALNAAADDLEGGLGVEGIPKTLWDFRQWLRLRASLPARDLVPSAGGESDE